MNPGRWWRRIRAALSGRRMHDELAEEMRTHLEMREESYRASGLGVDEARREARLRFGNAAALAEWSRDAWGVRLLDELKQDLRYALRQLRLGPGFAAVAVITIGVGLGLSTAAFTLYDTLALKPLAVRAPSEVVRVVAKADRTTLDELRWSAVDLIQRNARQLRQVVVTSAPQLMPAGAGAASEPVSVRFVSPSYFDAMGVGPAAGTLSAVKAGTVVLSYAFWSRRMNRDPRAIGQVITVQGMPQTIVGVAAASFAGTGLPPVPPDLWAPVESGPLLMRGVDWVRTDQPQWQLLARRAAGVTTEQLNAELKVLTAALPADSSGATLQAKQATFFQTDAGEFETLGQLTNVLMVAVGLILLIACVNLVNLLVARNAAREREVAMRLALGAARSRIARQLCTESALLGVLGGGCGLLLSIWLCRLSEVWIVGTASQFTGGAARLALDLSPDWMVFAYAGTLSVMLGIAVGLSPALRAVKGDVNTALKPGASDSRSSGARRQLLLTVQVASCLVLLTGAGLLLGGVWKSRAVTTGFDAEHMLVLIMDPSHAVTADEQAALIRQATARIAAIPGVRAASWADRAPYMGHRLRTFEQTTTHTRLTYGALYVSQNFFDASGIALVQGRGFTPEEAEQGRHVVVISEAVWRRFWPGQDIIGRAFEPAAWLMAPDSAPYTVVGIAKDVRNTYLSRIDEGYEYFPLAPAHAAMLLIRTTAAPEDAIRSIQAALAELGPDVATRAHLVTMRGGPLALQYLFSSAPATLSGGLALIGLLLSAVSLYGLVAHGVIRRTREIGIRVALGARAPSILVAVLRSTMAPVAWGAALGALGAAGVSIQMARMLAQPDAPDLTYGAGTYNPLVFAGVLGVLALVTMVASVIPAAKALRVDAMVALRQD